MGVVEKVTVKLHDACTLMFETTLQSQVKGTGLGLHDQKRGRCPHLIIRLSKQATSSDHWRLVRSLHSQPAAEMLSPFNGSTTMHANCYGSVQ